MLAKSKWGRALLHLLVMLGNGYFKTHIKGMIRELRGNGSKKKEKK